MKGRLLSTGCTLSSRAWGRAARPPGSRESFFVAAAAGASPLQVAGFQLARNTFTTLMFFWMLISMHGSESGRMAVSQGAWQPVRAHGSQSPQTWQRIQRGLPAFSMLVKALDCCARGALPIPSASSGRLAPQRWGCCRRVRGMPALPAGHAPRPGCPRSDAVPHGGGGGGSQGGQGGEGG